MGQMQYNDKEVCITVVVNLGSLKNSNSNNVMSMNKNVQEDLDSFQNKTRNIMLLVFISFATVCVARQVSMSPECYTVYKYIIEIDKLIMVIH